MCLLSILYKQVPNFPLVVAANRDEFYDRQGTEPQVWADRGIPFLAPQDPRAGGTWIGRNENGMFAAVTNRSKPRLANGIRSRGQLCADVLGQPSVPQAAEFLQKECAANRYNGFNLFFADAAHAVVAHYDGSLDVVDLSPGVYVIGNRDLNDASCWKVARMHALLEPLRHEDAVSVCSHLQKLLADNTPPPPGWQGDTETIYVTGERHGTLSSTIIAIADQPENSLYLHAQGGPKRGQFKEYRLV